MNHHPKSSLARRKMKACGLHLLLSLAIFLPLAAALYWLLYPSFHFSMSGGVQGLLLMFCVDVVLGPLLTLIIYNPRKPRKEIITDFLVIAAIQISALLYGAHTVYQGRPAAIIAYEYGTAMVLPWQDVRDYPEIQAALAGEIKTRLAGTPMFFYRVRGDEALYLGMNEVDEALLQRADALVRQDLDADEQACVAAQSSRWLWAVVAKYKGAYLLLDENFQYLGRCGEKMASF